jgi:hypothetical protein
MLIVKLLLLGGALIGMVTGRMSGAGGGDGTGNAADPAGSGLADGNEGALRAPGHPAGSDHDADEGFRSFGRSVHFFFLLSAVVFALLLLGFVLSMAGVFEHDYADPPV